MKPNKLKNGATIAQEYRNVVLAHWRGDWVTWKIDTERNAYWGHYYDNYQDAINDFARRVNSL